MLLVISFSLTAISESAQALTACDRKIRGWAGDESFESAVLEGAY